MRKAIKSFWVALKVAFATPLPDFTKQLDEEVLASDRRAQRLGTELFMRCCWVEVGRCLPARERGNWYGHCASRRR